MFPPYLVQCLGFTPFLINESCHVVAIDYTLVRTFQRSNLTGYCINMDLMYRAPDRDSVLLKMFLGCPTDISEADTTVLYTLTHYAVSWFSATGKCRHIYPLTYLRGNFWWKQASKRLWGLVSRALMKLIAMLTISDTIFLCNEEKKN